MLKQTTNFNVSFHLRAIFQTSFENSMILPAALSGRFFFLMNWCLCVWWTLFLVALFLTWTVVGGRRFRPTFGHLEFISVSVVIGAATIWQPSELSVEERNLLSSANQSFSVSMVLLYERARSHIVLSS